MVRKQKHFSYGNKKAKKVTINDGHDEHNHVHDQNCNHAPCNGTSNSIRQDASDVDLARLNQDDKQNIIGNSFAYGFMPVRMLLRDELLFLQRSLSTRLSALKDILGEDDNRQDLVNLGVALQTKLEKVEELIIQIEKEIGNKEGTKEQQHVKSFKSMRLSAESIQDDPTKASTLILGISHLNDFLPIYSGEIRDQTLTNIYQGEIREFYMYCYIHFTDILEKTHPGLLRDLKDIYDCEKITPIIVDQSAINMGKVEPEEHMDGVTVMTIEDEKHIFIDPASVHAYKEKYGDSSVYNPKSKTYLMLKFDETLSSHGIIPVLY